MQSQDIYNKSDSRSKRKSSTHKAKLYKIEDNKILYTVDSSEHNKNYLVKIQLLDLKPNRLDSIKDALNGDIKISCNCPAFLFHGYKFISWKSGVGIDQETRSPDKTNPNREGLACKHILTALEQMKYDYSKIYEKFKESFSKSIDKDNASTNNVDDNKNSDIPTSLDITILDNFKKACDKLYRDYNNFIKNNTNNETEFIDSKFYDKTDPSSILDGLSKPASKYLNGRFIGKLKSLDDIMNLINIKKNGFNVLLNSDINYLIRKLNSIINTKTESLINDIILSLLDYT